MFNFVSFQSIVLFLDTLVFFDFSRMFSPFVLTFLARDRVTVCFLSFLQSFICKVVATFVMDCPVCVKKGFVGKAFARHLKTHALPLFTCDRCKKLYANRNSLRKHLSICCVPSRPFVPKNDVSSVPGAVREVFSSIVSPIVDLVIPPMGTYFCIVCLGVFPTLMLLIGHMVLAHCSSPKFVGVHDCLQSFAAGLSIHREAIPDCVSVAPCVSVPVVDAKVELVEQEPDLTGELDSVGQLEYEQLASGLLQSKSEAFQLGVVDVVNQPMVREGLDHPDVTGCPVSQPDLEMDVINNVKMHPLEADVRDWTADWSPLVYCSSNESDCGDDQRLALFSVDSTGYVYGEPSFF